MKTIRKWLLKSVGWGAAMSIAVGFFFFIAGSIVGVVRLAKDPEVQPLLLGLAVGLLFFPIASHFGFNVSLWEQMKGNLRHDRMWFYAITSVTAFAVHFYYYWLYGAIDKAGYFTYTSQALMSLVVGAFSGIVYASIAEKEHVFYGEKDDAG